MKRRIVLAALLPIVVLAVQCLIPARASSSQGNISLARGWVHLPAVAPGLVYGGGCCTDQIVAGGPGLVLYERQGAGLGMYASATGKTWKQLPGPVLKSGEIAERLFIVGQRFIITGGITTGGSMSTNRFLPRSWASVNGGKTWRESPTHLQINAVIPGSDGVIAFVSDSSSTQLWTSADGVTWRELSGANGAFASAMVTSAVQGGPGYVAGGAINEAGGPIRATVWTSPDGLNWTEVPDAGTIFAGTVTPIDQLVAGPAGLAAVAEVSLANRDGIWVSRDGIHWQRAADDFVTTPALPSLPLAVSQRGFAEINDTGAGSELYSSPDGRNWTRVGSDDIFGGTASVEAMTGFHSGLAAFGGFNARPKPACAPVPGLPGSPSVLLWTPKASRTAPAPAIDPTDPWALRLRPQDIPTGYYLGQYMNLCAYLPTLGRHRAYLVQFAGFAAQGLALDIVTQRVATAEAAFRQVDRLVRQVPWVTSVEPVVKIQRMTELRATARLGNETRDFTIHVKDYECGDLARAAGQTGPKDCATYHYKSDVVVWRHGKVIGMVVTNKGRGLAVDLARKLLSRSEHPSD